MNISSEQVNKGNISYWYQADTIWTPTHLGTHLDAPCHFARNTWCVSDIPIERLYLRPGYVIDISHKIDSSSNPNYVLTSDDVKNWIKSIGTVKSGAVILIRTNWSKHWPDREKYFGLKSSNSDSFNFPGISVDAVNSLIALGVDLYGIGIEGPSVDNGPSEDFATHSLLALHNIYNLENVGPLIGKLPKDNFLITSLPMRIDSASGSPVRIVAQLTSNSSDQIQSCFVLISLVIIAITYHRNF
ncbi:isatin hydrolase-like isoform X2 [Panonychus citri]|nr:isatin hydrolase-like isoform X2 [Panonychus citri]